jgi:hypothetical protein
MKNTRIAMAGTLILLMLAFTSSLVAMAGDISGDDYDPAAAGIRELSVAALTELSTSAVGITYSGDDEYDLAAGGTPELSLVAFAADASLAVACSPSANEIAAQSALAADGGFSGDDAYDPAAGGTPDAVFC